MNYTRPLYRNKILLVLIMLLGSVLRLYGLNWDDSHHLHPDERFIVLTALNITWPDSFSDYLNPETSALSPYNTENYKSYIYGTFPLFLTKALANVFHYDAYGKLHIVGRLLSTLFDLGSLLLVYFIAMKIFSRHTGILAAAFYAVTVLPVQQSHFFTVDNFLVFWIIVTFSLLVIFMEKENYRALVVSSLMGVSFAFALASKVSAILFITIIAFAMAIKFVQSLHKVRWHKNILQLTSNCIVFLISNYLIFRLVQPYAFASGNWLDVMPQPDFWSGLDSQRRAISGEVMFPSQWQWVHTTPYLFPLKNLLLWGLGLPLGVSCLIGLGVFLGLQIKTITAEKIGGVGKVVRTPGFVAFMWILFSFAYGGGSFIKSMRYFLPIIPFLIIFAAYTCTNIAAANNKISRMSGVLIFILSLLWAVAYMSIYSRDTTRVAASKWIYKNIPETSVLANEQWDDPLPLRLPDDVLKNEHARHKNFEWFLMRVYDPDNDDKLRTLHKDMKRADYIILSSPRARETIGQLTDYFPIMSKYYRSLHLGTLGFEKVKECASYPHLFGFEINDSTAEESFWVYDHPRVHIYKKVRDLSWNEYTTALSN